MGVVFNAAYKVGVVTVPRIKVNTTRRHHCMDALLIVVVLQETEEIYSLLTEQSYFSCFGCFTAEFWLATSISWSYEMILCWTAHVCESWMPCCESATGQAACEPDLVKCWAAWAPRWDLSFSHPWVHVSKLFNTQTLACRTVTFTTLLENSILQEDGMHT